MATEADIQAPVCETRADQVGNFVDNIINTSVSKLSLEKHSKDEQLNERPTVEGENFLRPPSTGEAHSEVNNTSSDVSKVTEEPNQAVEAAANEYRSAAEVQQKDEEASSTKKDEDNCTYSSVVISELKVEDKLDDGAAKVVTQLSNETGSYHHGTNNSITKNIVLAKEINLPSEETELQEPFIAEGEEKPTEEKVPCNVTSEVSKEEESEQCKTTTEQEVLANERGVGDNSSTAAEEVSQGSCTPTETIVTLETSNKSRVHLNASFSKEEETTTQNREKIITTEDSGVPLENTLPESHGDDECQSKNLEDDATDHSIPTLAEKKEEASRIQIYDSQKECDEHLEEKTEIRPSTEVSMGDTNDIVPPATHNVKDKGEGIIEAELPENEPSTRCLSVEEEKQTETTPEMLHVTSEDTKVSHLSQENSIQDPPEEQTANANLHGNKVEAEEATNDAVDGQKESLESCPPIVSSFPKEGSTDAVLQEVTSKNVEVPENPTIGEGHSEINNVATDFSEVTKELDQTVKNVNDNSLLGTKSDSQKVEFAAIEETSIEGIQPNAEVSNSIEKEGDGGAVPEQCNTFSLVMNSEVKAKDTLIDPIVDDIGEATQLSKDISVDKHGIYDSDTEHVTLNKEIVAKTNILSEEIEFQTPCISEVENLKSEVSKEGADQCKTTSKLDMLENERSIEDNTNTVAAEVSQCADASLLGNTIESEEATTDGVDGQKESLESCSPVVSSSPKEECTSVVVQEISSDHVEVLENHSVGGAHTETTSVAPDLIEVTEEPDQIVRDGTDTLFPSSKLDDQKAEFAANEETSIEEIQPNVDDSISKEKEGDGGGVPEECSTDSLVITSEVKAGDTRDDLGVDDTKVEMQQSKDTSIEQHGTNDSLTENISLTKEILVGTNISSEETESQALCITEGEELNVQVKTIDKEYADDETTEENTSHDLKDQVSKEDEADQNKTASEQDALGNERSVEDNSDTAAGEVSQEDSTSTKTIPNLDISNSDELQSKCESNSSLSKQKEIIVEKGDMSVAASETLEDPVTEHSYPSHTEKAKESSLFQIEDSKTEIDEHLEEESEKLPLKEVSTQATDVYIPPVTDIAKERDEDLKEAELSENEPGTRCTSVEEDRQIETHEESLLVAPEDIEVSPLSQETECDEHLEEESEKLPSKEVSTRATDDKIPPITHVVKERDEDLKEVELSESEPGIRCNSVEEDRQIITHAESLLVAPEVIEVSTLSQENSTKGPTQEQSYVALHGSINEVEEATIDAVDQQNESFESFPPIISSSVKEGSMNAVEQEVKSDHADEKTIDEVDKQAEFIENLTVSEPHSQRNKVAHEISEVAEKPNQSAEFVVDEENQQNAEESNSTKKDGDRGVEPKQCNTDSIVVTSEVRARDTLNDIDADDTRVVTQISTDTSSNEHGTDDSFTETSSLTKEILDETNIPSNETESQAPCITEGDGLNVQVKTIGDKYQDDKPTEEDKSCNLTSEESKEVESDQNETTSEQKVFASERSAAEDVSQENSASTGTITTLETFTSNELQSNSDFTSSLSNEDETTVQKADGSLTTSDSLSENHGDIECQPKTLEDTATDHSNLKLAEISADSSFDQIEDSQLECEEHLEVESESLALTEASPWGTNDNASEAIDKVKDEGEDVKEVELSENDQSTRCTFLKEDVQIEQEATISEFDDQQKESPESSPPIVSISPQEGSMDAASKEVIEDHKDDTVEEVEKHKEVIENHSTTGSTEDTEGNSSITLEGSENQKENDIGKESERALLPLPLAREGGEELLNTEDSLNITSEDNKTPDLSQEIKTGSVTEEQDLTTHPQGTLDKRSDEGTEAKEDTIENVATEIPHEHVEENSVTQVDCSKKKEEEHLEKEEEMSSLIDDNTKRESIDEVDTNEESLDTKGIAESSLDCDKDPANEEDNSRKHIENSLIKEEESFESLQVTAKDIEATSLGQNTETSCLDEQSTLANSDADTGDKKENIAARESSLEDETPKQIIANTTQYEDKEKNLQLQEDCSQLEQIEDLGNDSESKHFTESPKDYTVESGLVKEEEKVEKLVEEQIITSNPQEICDKTQENIVDASDKKDDAVVNVRNGDNGNSLPTELDSSQDPSSEEALAEAINGVEPTAVNETTFANENAAKANLFEERKIESTLAKEEVCIESLQVEDEDIKANSSVQDRETAHFDEQATTTNSQDHKDETTIHLADVKEKVVFDKDITESVPREKDLPNVADGSQTPSLEEGPVENIDEHESRTMHEVKFVDESLIKADLIENEENTEATLIKEDVSIVPPQVAAEDIKEPCLDEVRETNSQEEQILSADPGGLIDDNKSIDPTEFQKETPKEEVSSEEIESVEKRPEVTAEKIPSEEDLDVNENITGKIHEVSSYKQQETSITEVLEESMTTSNEHASYITSLESEVPEKNNNQVVGEANTCDDKIDLEKVEVSNDGSTAVPTNETPTETDLRGSIEAEVQVPKQERDTETSLHNSSECASKLEGVNSEGKIDSNSCEATETEEHKKQDMERDAKPCPESADNFDITDDVQNLKEVPLPAEEEMIIETLDCKESDVVEGASKNMSIGHLEQNDTTKSFLDDKKSTEEVLEETATNDILPVSPSETSGLTNSEDSCTEKTALGDDEKLARDEKISDVSSAAPHTMHTIDTGVVKLTNDTDNIIDNAEGQMVHENTSVESLLVSERSATYLETKNDDEAPEIKETTPSAAECQDFESTNVEETSNYPCSLTEEKSNSDEVAFAPGENKSRYESNNQPIESTPVAENTLEKEETVCEKGILKDNISRKTDKIPRIKEEDEGTKDYEQVSSKEDVIKNSQQENEIKQEQQSITKETTTFKEDGSQTETVSKLSEEAIDKAKEDQEEKTLTNETIDEVLQQEEQAKSIEEAVQIATTPTNESDEQNHKDEICSLDIVQAKDEENIMEKSKEEAKEANIWTKPIEDEDKKASIEAKKLDCASQTEGISQHAVSDGAPIPEDNDVSTTNNTYSEEYYPRKSIVAEASTGSEDIALTEQASEATTVTAEVQETKAGIDLGAANPKSTEIESREVEELNEKCAVTEGTSTPGEPPVISTAKMIPEWTVGTPLDVQELSKISFEISNNQKAPVLETPERETEEKQLGGAEDVNDTESSINQSIVAETAQHEKREGSQQIDSPHSLPQAQCSDIKTSEKDLTVHIQGLDSVDVAELEAAPLPLKDKHDVLEADDTKNLNHEIEKSSKVEQEAECVNEEKHGVDVADLETSPLPSKDKHDVLEAVDTKNLNHEIEKSSKVEQEAECVNEERLDQEMEGKPESNEIGKSSLSDLFLVSKRESTRIADHSATEKEPTSHTEHLCAENSDEFEHENSKTDEEKDDEEDSHEQQKSDSVSEVPVMVEAGDADVKVAHKKSHNILSGVGSKVKHSIAKVKKAITGKSSHPKPPSPKKVTN